MGGAASAPAGGNSDTNDNNNNNSDGGESGPFLLAKSSPLRGMPNVGDCPFAHFVRFSFKVAKKPLKPVFLDSDKKPKWLVDKFNGSLPCYTRSLEEGTGAVVESTKIAEIALPPTDKDRAALSAISGVMPAVANYCKSGHNDPKRLENVLEVLDRVEKFLNESGTKFLSGETPGYADCHTITKLHILHVVGREFNGFKLDEERFSRVKKYCQVGFSLPEFTSTVYPDDEALKGWGDERDPPIAKDGEAAAPEQTGTAEAAKAEAAKAEAAKAEAAKAEGEGEAASTSTDAAAGEAQTAAPAAASE